MIHVFRKIAIFVMFYSASPSALKGSEPRTPAIMAIVLVIEAITVVCSLKAIGAEIDLPNGKRLIIKETNEKKNK